MKQTKITLGQLESFLLKACDILRGKMDAWEYLEKIYRYDSLFAVHETSKQAIAIEKQRIKA